MTLIRYGDTDGSPVIAIDDLEYTYDNGNKLLKVKDNTGNPSGFKEGVYTGDAFIYDDYGNLTQDKNKEITSIAYNHLNLPKEIIFENDENKKIIYLYNANGQKIKKTIFNSPSVSTVNYQGVFHYENDSLRFIATTEGYVNLTTEGYNYIYNYTDHLGNIRVSYFLDLRTRSVAIIEENHYYPFGLKHQGYNNISPPNNVYKYKYNGKEFQDELGLNYYDYGARNYDPAIGRWMNIDPKAELGRNWSSYTYAMNNPVYFIDPDGMWIDVTNDNETYRYKEGKYYSVDKKGGEWKEVNVDENSYHGKILTALNQIKGSKQNSLGSRILNLFANDEINVTIRQNPKEEDNHYYDGTIYTSFEQEVKSETTQGNIESPFHVVLSHELAHGLSKNLFDEKVIYKEWFNYENQSVKQDEVFASTLENFIREEQNLPLRTHYAGVRFFEKVNSKDPTKTMYDLTKRARKIIDDILKSKKK